MKMLILLGFLAASCGSPNSFVRQAPAKAIIHACLEKDLSSEFLDVTVRVREECIKGFDELTCDVAMCRYLVKRFGELPEKDPGI